MTATVLAFPAHIEALSTARAVLRDHDLHPIEIVDDACAAMERWSRDWTDLALARDVRRALGIRSAAEVNAEMRELYGDPAPRRVATLDSLVFWIGAAVCFGGMFAVGFTVAVEVLR
jgi:hypothetical protein